MALTDFHSAADLAVYRLLNQDGGATLDAVMRALSTRAFGVVFGLVLAVLLVIARGRRAVPAIVALGLAVLLSDMLGSQLVRPALGRMRPCYALPPGTFRWLAAAANGPSLPSLHASNMFALALAAALGWRMLAPLAYLVAIAVSVSRVYVGVHWPTDVLAGALWGSTCAAAAWALTTAVVRRVEASRPPS